MYKNIIFLVLAVARAVLATVLTTPYPGPVHHHLPLEPVPLAKPKLLLHHHLPILQLLLQLHLEEPC